MEGSSMSQTLTFTVAQFCRFHHISRACFYDLLREGRGPRTMKVGRRRLISREAAKEWREAVTKATAENAA